MFISSPKDLRKWADVLQNPRQPSAPNNEQQAKKIKEFVLKNCRLINTSSDLTETVGNSRGVTE